MAASQDVLANTRPASAVAAFMMVFYTIHSLDSTVKTAVILLLMRNYLPNFMLELVDTVEKFSLSVGKILEKRTSQPPRGIHESNSSSVEDSRKNITQQHNPHDGKNMKLPGEETLNEVVMRQSHVEDVTKCHVTKENFSFSQQGSILSQSTPDDLYFTDGKQEYDKNPKLNDNCLDDEEAVYSTTLLSDHTEPKSSSAGTETTSASVCDRLEDVDLTSWESEESVASDCAIDLRSSPLEEEEEKEDVRQPPQASTNQQKFSQVLQLYDAINKQIHMLSFIQGCVIGNEMIQVLISDGSDLDICKSHILNAIDFDPGPGILSVNYLNRIQ